MISSEILKEIEDRVRTEERERCARIAEGVEPTFERHWVRGSLYDTLRRETAAEIRRKPSSEAGTSIASQTATERGAS